MKQPLCYCNIADLNTVEYIFRNQLNLSVQKHLPQFIWISY